MFNPTNKKVVGTIPSKTRKRSMIVTAEVQHIFRCWWILFSTCATARLCTLATIISPTQIEAILHRMTSEQNVKSQCFFVRQHHNICNYGSCFKKLYMLQWKWVCFDCGLTDVSPTPRAATPCRNSCVRIAVWSKPQDAFAMAWPPWSKPTRGEGKPRDGISVPTRNGSNEKHRPWDISTVQYILYIQHICSMQDI